MTRRDENMEDTDDNARADTIKQIIDDYHDRKGRTIYPARRNDV